MDIGKAFAYVFDDPKWLKKILLAAFMTVVPVLGQIIVAGWLLDTLRNIRAGQQYPIPDWSGDDLARWLGRGVAVTVAVTAWILPCALVLSLIMACGSTGLVLLGGGISASLTSGGQGARDLGAGLGSASIIINCCLACLGILVALIIALGSMVPYIRFATTDRIDVGLDYAANFKLLFANIGPFLLFIVVAVVAGLVMVLVNTLTCGIGWLVTIPYISLVFAHLYAGLSRLLDRTAPAAA